MYSYPGNQRLGIGSFSFSLSPKIMKDGSITDINLGLAYTKAWPGEIRSRNTAVSKNEELQDVVDSLNAVSENIFEVFSCPPNILLSKPPPCEYGPEAASITSMTLWMKKAFSICRNWKH
jgi:hypothetical protein